MRIALAVVVMFAVASEGGAGVLHVPLEYSTIEEAMVSAVAADTVLVECGTYYEHDLTIPVGVSLVGASSDPGCVFIDAQFGGRGLFLSGLDDRTLVSGVTVWHGFSSYERGGGIYCNGSSPRLVNVMLSNNAAYAPGAGMCCEGSAPELYNVTFEANSAYLSNGGGGLACLDDSYVSLSGCTFHGNAARDGAGVYVDGSAVSLDGVAFVSNESEFSGGGLYMNESSGTIANTIFGSNMAGADGGGLYLYMSSPHLSEAEFFSNTADKGGGLYANYSAPILESSVLRENQAGNGAGLYGYGGGPYYYPELREVLIYGNVATSSGGGVYCRSTCRPQMYNVTIVENSAASGGGVYCYSSSPWLARVIIANSSSGDGVHGDNGSQPVLTCSDVFGNAGGEYGGIPDQTGMVGNISENPLFCGLTEADFTINEDSPCAVLGNDCGVLMGAYPVACANPTAVRDMSWGAIKGLYRH